MALSGLSQLVAHDARTRSSRGLRPPPGRARRAAPPPRGACDEVIAHVDWRRRARSADRSEVTSVARAPALGSVTLARAATASAPEGAPRQSPSRVSTTTGTSTTTLGLDGGEQLVARRIQERLLGGAPRRRSRADRGAQRACRCDARGEAGRASTASATRPSCAAGVRMATGTERSTSCARPRARLRGRRRPHHGRTAISPREAACRRRRATRHQARVAPTKLGTPPSTP